MSGKSRIEKILENLLGDNNVIEPPIGRDEKILYSILNDLEYTDPPHSIFEDLLLAIKNGSSTETEYAYENLVRDEKILFCKLNRREYFEPPHSRLERLLIKWLYLDLYLNIDGVPPFTFVSNGSPIIDYTIYGNTVQNGTPTPDSPVMPQGTGERTGNLFDENYPNISRTIQYIPLYVGEGSFTLSTTTPYDSGVANIFLLSGNVSSGASTPGNGAWLNHKVTTQSIDGYVTIAYRHYSGATSPVDYQTMLNLGSTPLPYEPYGYKIPISSANTTTPVYLGEVQTTRRVKKLVLTGEEKTWDTISGNAPYRILLPTLMVTTDRTAVFFMCSHFLAVSNDTSWSQYDSCISVSFSGGINIKGLQFRYTAGSSLDDFKSYLQQQYAAGTPVTVWYVLATEETAVVNEPLMKIGDYADTLSYEQTVVSIPTVSGRNTFDVLGDVKPSNVELTYAPRAPLLRTRKTILKK